MNIIIRAGNGCRQNKCTVKKIAAGGTKQHLSALAAVEWWVDWLLDLSARDVLSIAA